MKSEFRCHNFPPCVSQFFFLSSIHFFLQSWMKLLFSILFISLSTFYCIFLLLLSIHWIRDVSATHCFRKKTKSTCIDTKRLMIVKIFPHGNRKNAVTSYEFVDSTSSMDFVCSTCKCSRGCSYKKLLLLISRMHFNEWLIMWKFTLEF